ncbi:MAG: oligopeptide ABC transporter ATP-binding protein, partial [Rhodobacteraceae bacterium]|nr:oligopeptide ABC transporter ATP-binding protein [Paracoccaceae bacterium]
MGDIIRGRYPTVDAVSDVSLTLHRGEAVGIVGESGCGKSTLGRILVKLIPPSGGQVVFDGEPIEDMDRKRELAFRRRAQLVFQNPFDALNAHFTIRRSLYEPLHNAKIPVEEHDERVAEA